MDFEQSTAPSRRSTLDFRARATFGVAVAALTLLIPIAIMDFTHGEIFRGLGSLFIFTLLATNAILVHFDRCHQNLTLYCLVPAGMLFMTTVFTDDGFIGSLWCFPAIVACYCMLSERRAWMANLCILVFSLPMAATTLKPEYAVRVAATLIAISLFSAILVAVIDSLNRELQSQLTRDPMTGLLNRLTLREKLMVAIENNANYARPASVMAIDVDHFKVLNDEYGHDVGDRALIELARRIKINLRSTDHAFRTGGEEFLILLSDSTEREAFQIAERLRREIEVACIVPGESVTISIGVAQHTYRESWTGWLKRADNYLYEAKRKGRNRVTLTAQPILKSVTT